MMKNYVSLAVACLLLATGSAVGAQPDTAAAASTSELTLITDTAEEGFQLAVQLARKGVSTTQPDRDVLFMHRDVYAKNPQMLIASSQVIATYFQTIAEANDYWRD